MRANAMRARRRHRGKPKDGGERSVIAGIEPVNDPVNDPVQENRRRLDRDFQADRPNPKWLADFSYIWTAEGWLYVAVMLDLLSPRTVGWSMKAWDASRVMNAMMMAAWRRGKADALRHP